MAFFIWLSQLSISIYFSGHGSPGRFIPHDHSQNFISHKEIKDLFLLSKARYKICIADACFSGSILNGESSQGSFNNMMQINDANIALHNLNLGLALNHRSFIELYLSLNSISLFTLIHKLGHRQARSTAHNRPP